MYGQEELENYRARCEGWTCEKMENDEILNEIKRKLSGAITKIKKKIIAWKIGKEEWHSKEKRKEILKKNDEEMEKR